MTKEATQVEVKDEKEEKVVEEKEVQASEFPKKVKMDAKDDVIGMFVVLWRYESKQAA